MVSKRILTVLAVLALASVVAVSFVAPTDAEGDYAIEQVEYGTDAEGAYVYVALSKTTEDMVEWTVSGNGEEIKDFTFFDGPATYLDLGRELSDGAYALTIESVEIGTLTSQFTVGEPADNATVTFIVVNEEVYTERKVPKGQTLADVPEAPEVIGADFLGWFLEESEVAYNFSTPVEDNMVLYAHFGPAAPAADQTEKFVVAVSGEDRTVVVTAYDEKIIGKGTAIVKLYEKVDLLGMTGYVEVEDARQNLTISCNGFVFIEDVSDEIADFTAGGGEFALEATVTLNGNVQTSTYAPFIVLDKA